MRRILLLFLVFLLARSIEFEYISGPMGMDCFGESISENTIMNGEIRAGVDYMNVRVYDPNGRLLFTRGNETVIKFSITAVLSGTHQICIDNLSRKFQTHVIKVETGVFARDYSGLAKANNVKPIGIVLKQTDDMLTELKHGVYAYIKRKTEGFDQLDSVHNKMVIFSIITVAIMILLGIIQSWYLKSFFKSKKLI